MPNTADDSTVERRRGSAIEQHIQTVLIAIVVGSLTFAASYFFNDKADKAVLATQLGELTRQVAEMRGELRAANTNFATRESSIDHENRLRTLELRVVGSTR